MTRSASKRLNRNARSLATRIEPKFVDRWRNDHGSFDEGSSRALARSRGLDLSAEINWTLAAEIFNRLTAVEWF